MKSLSTLYLLSFYVIVVSIFIYLYLEMNVNIILLFLLFFNKYLFMSVNIFNCISENYLNICVFICFCFYYLYSIFCVLWKCELIIILYLLLMLIYCIFVIYEKIIYLFLNQLTLWKISHLLFLTLNFSYNKAVSEDFSHFQNKQNFW